MGLFVAAAIAAVVVVGRPLHANNTRDIVGVFFSHYFDTDLTLCVQGRAGINQPHLLLSTIADLFWLFSFAIRPPPPTVSIRCDGAGNCCAGAAVKRPTENDGPSDSRRCILPNLMFVELSLAYRERAHVRV